VYFHPGAFQTFIIVHHLFSSLFNLSGWPLDFIYEGWVWPRPTLNQPLAALNRRIAGTAHLLFRVPHLGSIAEQLGAAVSSAGLSNHASRSSDPVFSTFCKQYKGKFGISCHQILRAQDIVLAL
jgi:hypothetical protein